MDRKKILIIGNLNDTTSDINTCFQQYFSVQLCTGDAEIVDGMMKIVKPDLVFINLMGYFMEAEEVFELLSKEYKDIPVTTLGKSVEYEPYLHYYQEKQFENIERPVTKIEALYKCCYRMNIEPDDMKFIKKKSILVVDDNAVFLRTARNWFKDRYEVVLATSGTQAMTAIGKQRPDLILLDYEMPICDGRQVLEMIRADESIKDIPVVFLTGMSDRAHIEEVLKLKPEGYILKPVILEKLMRVIEEILNKQDV